MKDLKEIRAEIDSVDKELVSLYEKRMALTEQVADYKLSTGKKVFDKAREEEKLEKVTSMVDDPFLKRGTRELFEHLMSMSRKRQYQKLAEKGIMEPIPFEEVAALPDKNIRIVYQGEEKDKLVEVMRHGINSEKITHELMPEWAFAIPDAENTVRIMQEAPCLIAVLNTNQYTPFASIEREKRIVEICDSLSIGAAVENMILTATGYGLGTLWIANTCFAYNELIEFIGTDNQLTGIVAVGAANEAPPKRPRKALRDVVEYR